MTPFEKIKQDFTGKKVLIFGLGLQGRGVGTARFFARLGAQVTVTDLKTHDQLKDSIHQLKDLPITFSLGGHKKSDITDSDIIIRNASAPWHHELLELARSKNIPIKMDAALFFEYCLPKNSIGITGTRGKSTTTNLIHQILLAANKPVVLAGNTVSTASVDLIKNYQPNTTYIFELSSWQLQAFHQQKISPHIAVLTNLYPDHLLDRSLQDYYSDKAAIFAYQTKSDILFINDFQPELNHLVQKARSKVVRFSVEDLDPSIKTTLKGDHNRQNIAAAIAVADHLGINQAIISQVVTNFKPLPFRLQPIPNTLGISIINDSTSTTPIAATKALEAYPNSILIHGGTSKQLPTDQLVKSINQQAKAIILLPGTGTDQIKPHIKADLIKLETKSLKDALNQAVKIADKKDTILFSPGFTSFGLFTNEFDRGQKFNQAVKDLR